MTNLYSSGGFSLLFLLLLFPHVLSVVPPFLGLCYVFCLFTSISKSTSSVRSKWGAQMQSPSVPQVLALLSSWTPDPLVDHRSAPLSWFPNCPSLYWCSLGVACYWIKYLFSEEMMSEFLNELSDIWIFLEPCRVAYEAFLEHFLFGSSLLPVCAVIAGADRRHPYLLTDLLLWMLQG